MGEKHSSVVGGSTAERFLACHGSHALVRSLPKIPGSEAAKTGTALHTCVEIILNSNLDITLPAFDWLERTPAWKADNDCQFDEPQMFANAFVPVYDDAEDDYTNILIGDAEVNKLTAAVDWFREKHVEWSAMGHVEVRFEKWLDFPGLDGAGGTADVVVRVTQDNGNVEVHIVDWKFGDGIIVRAETSTQFLFYATCAAATEVACDANTITSHCFQPSIQLESEAFHSYYRYTPAELQQFRTDILDAAKLGENTGAEFRIGEHCKFCPANEHGACQALTDASAGIVKKSEMVLTPLQLGELLDWAPIVEDAIKKLRALARQSIQDGAAVPGWALEPGRKNRVWKDGDAADKFLARQGLKHGDRNKVELISPAQAEKALAGDENALKNLEKYIETPKSDKLTLVKASGETAAQSAVTHDLTRAANMAAAAALSKS